MADEVKNAENSPAKDAKKFWQILQEVEDNHEHRRSFSGAIDYSCFFQAVYRGRVQMGFEDENKETI